jgi:hypothetical protein
MGGPGHRSPPLDPPLLAGFSFAGVPPLLGYLSDSKGIECVSVWTIRPSMERVPASGDRRGPACPASNNRQEEEDR